MAAGQLSKLNMKFVDCAVFERIPGGRRNKVEPCSCTAYPVLSQMDSLHP